MTSIWLLTASCLVGGAADAPKTALPPPAAAPAMVASSQACDTCVPACCRERRGLLARLLDRLFARRCTARHCPPCETVCQPCPPAHCEPRCCDSCCDEAPWRRPGIRSLFHRAPPCDPCCCVPCETIVPQPSPVPKVMPDLQPVTENPLPLIRTGNREVRGEFELRREYLDRVKNAPDYSWVTGQLFYIHADGGLWVVRYAPIDREDRYGGSVVLAPTVSMRNFREGDLVTVRGEVLNQGRASKRLGGPLYRAITVEMVERAD